MNWPLFIGICFAVLAVAGIGLAAMGIDEPAKTSPARARPLLAFQSGPGKRSALSILLALTRREQEPQGRDLPESMRERDKYAREAWDAIDARWKKIGALKVAEYNDVLDVMAGEQDTAVMERIS